MDKFTELKGLLASAEQHAESFYTKGVAVAGKRLRKAMLDIKNKASEIRVQVQDIKAVKN